MRWIADFAYLLTGLFFFPVLAYQAIMQRKNRRGWRERFGFVRKFDPERPRIWIHGVSLGEIDATPKLAAAIRRRFPDHDLIFSTTTDTGFARAVELYGRPNVFRFPLDFSLVVSRVLRRVRPTMIVLVELEVWFNLTRLASARGVPVAVVNGRLTERSARRLRRLGPIGRSMFRCLSWVGAQDEAIAARFASLGVDPSRIAVTSSLKWDSALLDEAATSDKSMALATGIDGRRPVWVCGSTGPGEERIILDAYRRLEVSIPASRDGSPPESPRPYLVLVPRKPERFDEVAALIQEMGYRCLRRRDCLNRESPPETDSAVLLVDTTGELRSFYALADVVFVGRSLVPMGGSNLIEAAALKKPVLVGPHMENFRLPFATLRNADAIRVVENAPELAEAVQEFLSDRNVAAEMAGRAHRVVMENRGATERTVEGLARFIHQGCC